MSNKTIRKLIENRLKVWAAARNPVVKVAYENAPFTIPPELYVRGFLLPAETASDDLAGDHRRYQGLYQVSIYAPINTGPGAAESVADEIASLFPAFDVMTDTGFKVQVVSPVSNGRPDQSGDRYMLPVSFRYRADVFL